MNGLGQKRTPEQRDAAWHAAYGSIERVLWMKNLRSVVGGGWPCVNAHTRSGGTGKKAAYTTIIPVTDAEHRIAHGHGWSVLGLDTDRLDALAAEIQQRWLAFVATHAYAW